MGLPERPDELEHRFVGRHLVLRDRTFARALSVAAFVLLAALAAAQDVQLPLKEGSYRFVAIGDTGSGSQPQRETGSMMAIWQKKVQFKDVIMLGDNIYGSDSPADMRKKFEEPYKELLASGVKFHAALGNHDNPNQRFYALFNMGGEKFYTFKPHGNVRFFALDSNYMDKPQREWLQKELSSSGSEWKICYFHHPLYSSARAHGSAKELRTVLEPLFVEKGVSVVFAGHDHTYERVKPQQGIIHFVVGSTGQLRPGDLRPQPFMDKGNDRDFVFVVCEIIGDDLHFQAVNRRGDSIDHGIIRRRGADTPAPAAK